MAKPKALIICVSIHHGNTKKIADSMAKVLGAKVVAPSEFDPKDISKYDLIGFGSGIYAFRPHLSLLKLIDSLPYLQRKVFIFSTSSSKKSWHSQLKQKLGDKGYTLVGEFCCPGWDTFGPLKLLGGLNKGRPNSKDLEDATNFAKSLVR